MRTHKVLAALMNGAWIVTVDWFIGALSLSQGGQMPNELEFESPFYKKRAKRRERELFGGLSFYFYGEFIGNFTVHNLSDFVAR